MNTPVKFEIAKLLKEKGFDLPVGNYYLLRDNGIFLHEGFEDDYWGDNRIVNWNKEIVGIKPFRGFVSAPTIADVVTWFYKKHGIWVVAWRYIDDSSKFYFEIDSKGDVSLGLFNSPEEAYEAAIEYALTNLI